MTPLWILIAAHAGTVHMDGSLWLALQGPDVVEEKPQVAVASGRVARVQLTLKKK